MAASLPWRMPDAMRYSPVPRGCEFEDPYEFAEDAYYLPSSQPRQNVEQELFRRRNSTPQYYRPIRRDRSSSQSTSPKVKEVRIIDPNYSSSKESSASSSRRRSQSRTRRSRTKGVAGAPKFNGTNWATFKLRFEAYAALQG